MMELMLTMFERLGIIVTVAFILTRFPFIRQLINQSEIGRNQKIAAIIFFGLFGIIGTYTGLTFNTGSSEFFRWAYEVGDNEAIANSRVIGIVIAGLLGGYKVGIGAGIIAGIHRFTLGGFTALSCGLSAIIAGIIAAAFRKKGKDRHLKISTALLVGSLAETVQMIVIILISKPFNEAIILVQSIGLPMIIANGIGSALFLLIIQNVLHEEERIGAFQAQKALSLAETTLTYLRKGLSTKSAKAVCNILYREINTSAIAITDHEKILAHIGLADDHHKPNIPILTEVTKQVLSDGKLIISKEAIHCSFPDCPLQAAVIAPLKRQEETIGTLKFYFRSAKEISNVEIQLIKGLSSLLSHQLEIAEVEKATQLAKEAEIKALQAQVSPHFLFNSINIIISLIRINPNKARKLLIALSHFFRQNLAGSTSKLTSLEDEIKHVKSYLSIEEARFVDKLRIIYDIDDDALHYSLPPLILQPLVENAVKHGIKDKEKDCIIKISVKENDEFVNVTVSDNGTGIPKLRLEQLGNQIVASEKGTGIGLYNLNRRLVMMYGDVSSIKIESEHNRGTNVSFKLRKLKGGGVKHEASKSIYH